MEGILAQKAKGGGSLLFLHKSNEKVLGNFAQSSIHVDGTACEVGRRITRQKQGGISAFFSFYHSPHRKASPGFSHKFVDGLFGIKLIVSPHNLVAFD